MRRYLPCTTVAALGIALLVSPAHAENVVVDGDDFAGSDITIASQGCLDPAARPASPPSLSINGGIDAPMLGEGYVGWTPAGSGYGVGPLAPVHDPSKLISYSIAVNSPNSFASWIAVAEYRQPGDAGVWKGTAAPAQDQAPGWHTVTVPASTVFAWRHYSADGRLDQSPGSQMALSNFVNDRGGVDEPPRVGVLYGCDGDPFFMDALTTTSSGGATTYDFEGYQSKLSLNPGSRSVTIVAGESLPLRAVLRRASDGSTMPGPVTIEYRRSGSRSFQKLESKTVGSDGTLTASAQPRKTVTFRATYPGTKTIEGSTAVFTVRVRTNVVAKLAKKRVLVGDKLRVTGRVAPERRARVALERYVNGKWRSMRRARTSPSGEFAIEMRSNQVGKSYWRVHAYGGGGNLDGNSVWLRLQTVKPPKPPHHGGGHHTPPPQPSNPTPPPPSTPPPPPPPPGPFRP